MEQADRHPEDDLVSLQRAEVTGVFDGSPTLQKAYQDFQQRLQEAQITGDYTDENGNVKDTLDKLTQELQQAQVTGVYKDNPTLAAQAQAVQAELQRVAQAQEQFQFLTQQTGIVGGGQAISAASLGVSLDNIKDANGNIDYPATFAASERLQANAQAGGITLTDEQISTLLAGGTVRASGEKSLVRLQEERQTLNDALQRAYTQGMATGTYVDPSTGDSYATLASAAQELDERVQRAQQIGIWQEEGASGRVQDLLTPEEWGVYAQAFGFTMPEAQSNQAAGGGNEEAAGGGSAALPAGPHGESLVSAAILGVDITGAVDADGNLLSWPKLFEMQSVLEQRGITFDAGELMALLQGNTIAPRTL